MRTNSKARPHEARPQSVSIEAEEAVDTASDGGVATCMHVVTASPRRTMSDRGQKQVPVSIAPRRFDMQMMGELDTIIAMNIA